MCAAQSGSVELGRVHRMEPKALLAKLRANRLATYALAGAVGGGFGALIGELVPTDSFLTSKTAVVVSMGLWMAAIASVLAAALFAGGEWHQRHELRPDRVAAIVAIGAVAGFVSGAVAQTVYSVDFADEQFKNLVVRTFCWGLAGALLGALLSRSVPNLSLIRSAVAGFIGGVVGCVGFLAISTALPETVGRVVGFIVLGSALGVAMHAVEAMSREASLEVFWAPYETTTVGLGVQPVTVGGGEDHIFVRGLPPHVSSIVFDNGQIEHIETATGKRTPLQDGNRLRIGGLNMIVHAAGKN